MKVTALAGGVGGAKLANGLYLALKNANPPGQLTVIVNTGDDFEHYGLTICPDLDTVCYTLGGLSNPETGWGRAGETWRVMGELAKLGGPDWFNLGDLDLSTHLERTRQIQAGVPLSEVTRHFCELWGIDAAVLPMSDDRVRTIVLTKESGELAFQEYFVHHRCEPAVSGFRFDGIEAAKPAAGVLEAIREADLIVFCPSNPWVSIDPILAVSGVRAALTDKPILAVSPIIQGKTVKGPAAKMYQELGISPSARAVANHYDGLVDIFVFDTSDQAEFDGKDTKKNLAADILMKSSPDQLRLAREVIEFYDRNMNDR